MSAATMDVIQALPVAPVEELPAVRPAMFDLVLRRPRLLDRVLRDERSLPRAIQELVSLSVVGLAVYGLVVGGAMQLMDAGAASHWAVLWAPVAFVGAFLGALGLCLPSFYFFTQLAGLDAPFRLVTAQALRGVATTAVLLLGAAPFFAAWALAGVVGLFRDVDLTIGLGMVLPFLLGLFGVGAMERAFRSMLDVLPLTHAPRGNFVRRMVLAWGALFTAIAPVALYRLGEWFGLWS